MKRMSRSPRPVRIAATSPLRSSAGPATERSPTPSSSRTMYARLVLPRPGGPISRRWSSASLRPRAASSVVASCSLTRSWPTNSSRLRGRSERSSSSSSGRIAGARNWVSSAAVLNRSPSGRSRKATQRAGYGRSPRQSRGGLHAGIATDASCRFPEGFAHTFLRGRIRIRAGERGLRLHKRVAELDERVTGDKMRLRRERRGRLRFPDRAEPLLQLEHDPLGSLFSDPRDRLEARRVLERDRAAQLVRRGARDDRQRDFRADPLDGEQQLEELALGSLGRAEQLQDVLPHMKIRLEHDLSPGLRLPPGAVRGVDEVADAADIQNDAGRRARDDLPAKPRDHEVRLGARPDGPAAHRTLPIGTTRRCYAILSSGGASAWQIATARASAAWCGVGGCLRPRIAITIRCTCAFSARP